MEGLQVQLLPVPRPSGGPLPVPRRPKSSRGGFFVGLVRMLLTRLGLAGRKRAGAASVSPQVRHGPAAPRR